MMMIVTVECEVMLAWALCIACARRGAVHSPGRSDWRPLQIVTRLQTLLFGLFRWPSLICLPTMHGRCCQLIESQLKCKNCWKFYPKLANLHEITQFSALLISKFQEKWCCILPKISIENVPCANPMGIRKCCPLFQYRRWGKHSDGMTRIDPRPQEWSNTSFEDLILYFIPLTISLDSGIE